MPRDNIVVAQTWPNNYNIMQHPLMVHEKIDHFQIWFNNTQHVTTWWPNGRNMLRPTMLWYVALLSCHHLSGAELRPELFLVYTTKQDSDHLQPFWVGVPFQDSDALSARMIMFIILNFLMQFLMMLTNIFQNLDLVRNGMVNLAKQIENAQFFGVHAVVAVNRFPYVTIPV